MDRRDIWMKEPNSGIIKFEFPPRSSLMGNVLLFFNFAVAFYEIYATKDSIKMIQEYKKSVIFIADVYTFLITQ